MTPTQDPPQTLPGDFFDKLDQQTGTQQTATQAPAATLPGDFFDKLDQQNKDKEKKPPAAPSAWWDPFNREQHPWLAATPDLVEGALSGAASTLHGINQLVTKGAQYLPGSPQVPNIIPEEYTKAPPSIAGNIGHYGEQAAEFLLPASKLGTAGKAIDAAASVPYLARLTAKAGLEAIPAYGITLAQTGGDTNAAKNAALTAGALTAALPLVGQAYSHLTGMSTGAGEYAVNRAMQNPTPELMAAMRGEITEADVLANTRQAVANVAQKRSADYLARLNQLNLNTRVNLNPTLQTMDQMLGQFRVNQVLNPQTGKMELDFAQSHLMLDAAAQQKIRSVFDTVAGYQWNDVRSVDALKRAIDGEYAGSGQAGAFVQAVKNELRDSLDKTVPGYRSMTKEYAEASDFMNNLAELSTGNKNDGVAIRKLAGALKQNNNYRKDLVEALDAYTGKDLVGQIAGSRLNSVSPRGIMGTVATMATGITGHQFLGDPMHLVSGATLASLFGFSPRAVGEAAAKAGILSRLTKAGVSSLPSAFHVTGQQPDYDRSVLDQNFAAPPSKPPDYGKSIFDHYDDGGEVDSDSSEDDVLRDIVRRGLINRGVAINPDPAAEAALDAAPGISLQKPDQAVGTISNIPGDTSYSETISRANPMPEWWQRGEAAMSGPVSTPTMGGSPMSLADLVQVPQSKGEAAILAAGALIPGSKVLKGAKGAVKLGTTLAEGAAPETGILSKAINAAGKTVRGGLDAAGEYVPAAGDVEKMTPKVYAGLSGGWNPTDVPASEKIQTQAEKLRDRTMKAVMNQLSWQNWGRPALEANYGTMVPSKAADPKTWKLRNTPDVVQRRTQEARDFLAQPTEPWKAPDYGIFDRRLIRDAMEGFPGVPQTEYPRNVATDRTDLSHILSTYEDPVNRDIIRKSIERGRNLGGDTFYASLYPLKVAAMDAGMPAQEFDRWVASVAPGSARNSIFNENAVGNFLRNMNARGIPLTKENVVREMAKFKDQYHIGLPLMDVHRQGAAKVLEEGLMPRDVMLQNATDSYKIPTYAVGKAGDFKHSWVGDVHGAKGESLGSVWHPYFSEAGGFTGNEYGPAENYMRGIAREMDIPTGTAQASRWIGGGPLTGLRSEGGDALDMIERQAAYSMHNQGLPTDPVSVRKYILNLVRQGGVLSPWYRQEVMPEFRQLAPGRGKTR